MTQSTFIQPVESSDATEQPKTESESKGASGADSAKQKQALKDRQAKIFKQHVEIVSLKNDLKTAVEEKAQLEQEIKSRSEEVYKMNEKMIFLEYEKQAEATKQMA